MSRTIHRTLAVAGLAATTFALAAPVTVGAAPPADPTAEASVECVNGEGFIVVTISNGDAHGYDIYIEDTQVATDQEATDDSFSYGPYAAGTYFWVAAYFDTESSIGKGEVEVNCTDEGSGTVIPGTGSNSDAMMLVAGGLVLAGSALLLARRTRQA